MDINYGNEEFTNGIKVLAILGSPRKAGYTSKLLGTLLRQFPKGTEIETISIFELNPTPCNACGYCKACDGCSKKDLDEFFKKFESADIIIFATPVYNMSVPAPLKALLDRFQRYFEARYRRNKSAIEKKRKAVIMVTSGGDGEVGYEVVKHQFLALFPCLNIELRGTMLARNTDKCGVDKTDLEKAAMLYRSVR